MLVSMVALVAMLVASMVALALGSSEVVASHLVHGNPQTHPTPVAMATAASTAAGADGARGGAGGGASGGGASDGGEGGGTLGRTAAPRPRAAVAPVAVRQEGSPRHVHMDAKQRTLSTHQRGGALASPARS